MKIFKIGFLAFIAVAAMSFTLVTNTKDEAKRDNIEKCYRNGSLEWLSANCLENLLDCNNKATAIGKYIKASTFTLGTYNPNTEVCPNGSLICCVSFEDAGTTQPPCGTSFITTSSTQVRDFTGAFIPVNHYVKVKQVECKQP